MPGFGSVAQEPPLELLENVQVLQGAAGFMYGFTSPGGVINLTTKRPKSEPFADLVAGYEQNDVFRAHLDTGTATRDGRFGIRLNLVGEDGRNRHFDTKIKRYAIGLNADAHLTPTTTLQLNLVHSRRRLFGDSFGFYPADTDVPVPKPISGTTRLAPDYSFYRDYVDSVSPSLIQQLGSGWTARLDTSWASVKRAYHDSELDGLTADGDYALDIYTFTGRTITKAGQLLISGDARTGPLSHAIAIGAYHARSGDRTGRYADGTCCGFAFAGSGNLFDGPVPDFPDPGLGSPSLSRGYRSGLLKESALFASDTVGLSAHWQVLLGGRYVWRDQHNFADDGTTTFADRRHKLTPTAALLWKPKPTVTVYVSYAQSLQAGGTAPDNAANAGQNLPPIASKQYEAGVKAEVRGLLLTAAAFRIDRGFEFLKQRDAPLLPLYVQDGVQRHDGIEMSVSGRIGAAWRLVGGIQLLDPKIREGDPDIAGNRPPGVPRFQAKLFVEYAPPALPGAALNVAMSHVSGSFIDPTNEQRLDGFTTFDVGARYRVGLDTPITLRASVANLAGRRYWMPAEQFLPGAPRTIRLSAEAAF